MMLIELFRTEKKRYLKSKNVFLSFVLLKKKVTNPQLRENFEIFRSSIMHQTFKTSSFLKHILNYLFILSK